MPELPEVETTVKDLKKKVLKRAFVDVWTDAPKLIRMPFSLFKKEIKGRKIINIRRRAKLILFELSGNKTLLVHQKMTGHFLLGKWKKGNTWEASSKPLLDKMNSFIHLMFWLDNGKMLAFSDLRKFARIELLSTEDAEMKLKDLGPEPLEKSFTLRRLEGILKGKKGRVKQVLMNPGVIAGIGNIYSDEILFDAKVNPFKMTSDLSADEIRRIYKSIKKILKKGIKFRGESFSDWRDIEGKKGFFDAHRMVYHKKKCSLCGTLIEKKKIGGRTAHFCPICQKL